MDKDWFYGIVSSNLPGFTFNARASRCRARRREEPQCRAHLCYKNEMKTKEQWVLFKYVGRDFTPISKPFKTRQAAERARANLPTKDQRSTAIVLLRSKE